MKPILLVAFFFLSYTLAFSQADDKKECIGLSVGASVPIGDFASTNQSSSTSGYAKTGGMFDLSFSYRLSKNFGIAALARGQQNPTDEAALQSQTAAINRTVTWSVSTNSWAAVAGLAGLYGSFILSTTSTTSLDVKALIGGLSVSSPDINIIANNAGAIATVSQASASASSIAYLVSAGIRQNWGEHFSFLINLDYLTSSPQLDNINITATRPDGTVNQSSTSFKQPVSTLNVCFGIGYRIK